MTNSCAKIMYNFQGDAPMHCTNEKGCQAQLKLRLSYLYTQKTKTEIPNFKIYSKLHFLSGSSLSVLGGISQREKKGMHLVGSQPKELVLQFSEFPDVCLCFLMVFQQAVTHRIRACEAYTSPVFYKPVQYFASLLVNGTNKLISMGSQPNLKFNFNWAQPNLKFNFNWVTAQTII